MSTTMEPAGAMNGKPIGETQKFFKGVTTALLMPIALLAGASIGTVIALVAAVLIYGALIFHGVRWLARRAFAAVFPKSFRRAVRGDEVSDGRSQNSPEPPTAAGRPPGGFSPSHETEVWNQRETAHRKWLQ